MYRLMVINKRVTDSPTLACNALVGMVKVKLDTMEEPMHGMKYRYIKGRIIREIFISTSSKRV